MQAANKLFIIGIGYKPLAKKAHEVLKRADVILASRRLFEVFSSYNEFESSKGAIKVINNVAETIEFARNNYKTQKIVLLASGDPMFFGIGRKATFELGKDAVEILPDLSSMQVAFSKVGEAWDDAFLMSLHGGPDPEKRRRLPYEINDIPFLLERYNKIAVLTDKESNPSEIARVLSLSPMSHSQPPILYVCERLGYSDEKITAGTPEEVSAMRFDEPNVVIIRSASGPGKTSEPRFGLTDEEIVHSRGLITKDEIRAVAIHKLRLPARGVIWDIGAGSGSVSLEIARLFPGLQVFAVEKESDQVDNIRKNRLALDALNITVVEGTAPGALKDLPSPDRVFIGGSGGELKAILRSVSDRMNTVPSGIIVLNVTKIESLHQATGELKRMEYAVDISQVSVSRTRAIGEGAYLSALNPVFVVSATKKYAK